MIITSDALRAAMSAPVFTQNIRIDLMDRNENVIERIDTLVIDGSLSVDGDRDVMRTVNFTADNSDGSLTWQVGGRIWIDKRFQLYIGLQTLTGSIEYVPQGVFLLQQPTADSKTQQVTFTGVDKFALFEDGKRGKFANPLTVPKGTLIGDAIKLLAQQKGETKFAFEYCAEIVPYDLTWQAGDSIGKAMKELAAIPVRKIYYDVNGYLRFQPAAQDLTLTAPTWRYTEELFTLYTGSEKILVDDNLFNKVIVVGGSSQTYTVSAIASNDDQDDPFSTKKVDERILFYNGGSPDPLITTKELAQARADYELQRSLQVVEMQRFSADPNFLHEAGDVIEIIDPLIATNDKYELKRFNIPFKTDAQMTGEAVRVKRA